MLDVVLEAVMASSSGSILSKLSILVVLDVVLEVMYPFTTDAGEITFNPCCAGCSSGSNHHLF